MDWREAQGGERRSSIASCGPRSARTLPCPPCHTARAPSPYSGQPIIIAGVPGSAVASLPVRLTRRTLWERHPSVPSVPSVSLNQYFSACLLERRERALERLNSAGRHVWLPAHRQTSHLGRLVREPVLNARQGLGSVAPTNYPLAGCGSRASILSPSTPIHPSILFLGGYLSVPYRIQLPVCSTRLEGTLPYGQPSWAGCQPPASLSVQLGPSMPA